MASTDFLPSSQSSFVQCPLFFCFYFFQTHFICFPFYFCINLGVFLSPTPSVIVYIGMFPFYQNSVNSLTVLLIIISLTLGAILCLHLLNLSMGLNWNRFTVYWIYFYNLDIPSGLDLGRGEWNQQMLTHAVHQRTENKVQMLKQKGFSQYSKT